MDLVIRIIRRMYSMQRILIHKKANIFVKYGHLLLAFAANLVASS